MITTQNNCTCGEHALLINAVQQYDPTRTLTLRDRFARDAGGRFRRIANDVVTSVSTNDVFGLKVNAPASPQQFAFPRNADKIEAFMEYLNELEKEYVFSGGLTGVRLIREAGRTGSIETAWANVYIEDAYQRGIRRARLELKRSGVETLPEFTSDDAIRIAFNQPFHADTVGVLYTRVFNELTGITNAMDQQVSRVLADGLIAGNHPNEIARNLNAVITGRGDTLAVTDSLGRFIPAKRRAEMLARTEIIRAHHLANVQEYRNAGIVGVKVLAEWSTAQDGRVCQLCAPLNGQIFTLDEVEGMIPVHPNCRCIIIPIIPT